MNRICRRCAVAVLSVCLAAGLARADTRDEVVKRGYLQCGVSTGLPGFSNTDDKGNWAGFDVEICRAIAAATLGDAAKVKYVPLTAREQFTALQAGDVDVLSRNTAWTLTRDTALGVKFVGASYYDRQGFMVKKALSIKSVRGLAGAAICIQAGTTVEANLTDYFKEKKIEFKPIFLDTADRLVRGLESGRCDVLSGELSRLHGLRTELAHPEDAVILPETISREPLGLVVRQGDDEWFNVVRWTLFAMLDAEELGVTSTNVDAMKSSASPAIRRLLGLEGIKGQGLGLADDWAYRIVKEVGNYGEVFARTLGKGTPLDLDRGSNALWINGGLQYAPPIH